MRSFRVSEQFYEKYEIASEEQRLVRKSNLPAIDQILTRYVVHDATDGKGGVCNICSLQDIDEVVLMVMCLNCGSFSTLCYPCSERNPSKLPVLGSSCGGSTGDYRIATINHINITIVRDTLVPAIFNDEPHMKFSAHDIPQRKPSQS